MATPTRARATLAIMGGLAVVLTFAVLRPFWAALALASVLAGALYPWHVRLSRLLRGRTHLSSTIFTGGVVLAILVPVSSLAAILIKEAADGIAWIRSALRSGGVEELILRSPESLQPRLRQIVELLSGADVQVQELAGRVLPAVGAVGGVLSATATTVLQILASLIAFFFLLIDGPRLVRWLERAIPLEPGRFHELLDTFARVSRAVLFSSLATAAIQAAAALVGYLIGRVPQPIFFTFSTFIVALIPAVGAASVVLLVAGLQLATGHLASAIFLAVWGVLVVSLVDNIVKPYLIRGGVEIHGAVVFFALLGGVAAFGPVGLLAGPLIVAFLITVVRIYSREEEQSQAPPQDSS